MKIKKIWKQNAGAAWHFVCVVKQLLYCFRLCRMCLFFFSHRRRVLCAWTQLVRMLFSILFCRRKSPLNMEWDNMYKIKTIARLWQTKWTAAYWQTIEVYSYLAAWKHPVPHPVLIYTGTHKKNSHTSRQAQFNLFLFYQRVISTTLIVLFLRKSN